jgi:hypothetical protein
MLASSGLYMLIWLHFFCVFNQGLGGGGLGFNRLTRLCFNPYMLYLIYFGMVFMKREALSSMYPPLPPDAGQRLYVLQIISPRSTVEPSGSLRFLNHNRPVPPPP